MCTFLLVFSGMPADMVIKGYSPGDTRLPVCCREGITALATSLCQPL